MLEEALSHTYTIVGVWGVALLWVVILGSGLHLLRSQERWWKRLGLFVLVLALASLASRWALSLKWAGGEPWGMVIAHLGNRGDSRPYVVGWDGEVEPRPIHRAFGAG